MASDKRSREPGDIVTQPAQEINHLEIQIKDLLRSMEVVDDILPSGTQEGDEDNERPETRMLWHDPSNSKNQKRGKTLPKPVWDDNDDRMETLSSLDIMEMVINEKVAKYTPLDNSVFFVPILENCVFGVTLLNSCATKLRKPRISLSVLDPSASIDQPTRRKSRCFLYDVQVTLKDRYLERIDSTKVEQEFWCQDFVNDLDFCDEVMPGCEVLVTATFQLPTTFLAGSGFSLILSVYLDGKELWAREVPISSSCFTAASIDEGYKNHHSTLLAACGKEKEAFKLERLLSQGEMSLHKSLQRFLLPLGFENIQSFKTGTDTVIEIYASHQPSWLWGTCFKIEKCFTKPAVIRCLVTSRSKEQMMSLFAQFKSWLLKHGSKRHGLNGITISQITPENNLNIYQKFQAEIDLIIKFQQVKNSVRKERESGRVLKRKVGLRNDIGSIESRWLHEYSICVEKTDLIFV